MDQNPKKEIVIASIVAVVVAVATAITFLARQGQDKKPQQGDGVAEVKVAEVKNTKVSERKHLPPMKWPEENSDKARSPGGASKEQSGDSAEDAKAEEERREAEEEKKVEAFDSMTDKWMNKEGGEVSLKDMDDFVSAFKSIPARRREECLQRALNLVSDEHVLLLAGILFDNTVEKEYVELVFNDVLNRDESVKKLILPKIYKDPSHPCWADTAWILDVTGEIPKKPSAIRRNQE